ncbi:titin-like isoform X2 [Branchiostoma floridae]|uniref:Titin-like isoform X2 n=1 Tax=Branchiostoma floridae TaxID=7739 RepID=A0A9J7LMV1_BRAFL|nr:titin-like isoform X2 [Branchiostoma floridae]
MPPTSLKDVVQPASLGFTRVLTTIQVDVNIDDLGNVRIDCVREDKDLGTRALLPRKSYWTEEYRWDRLTVGSPVERRNWSLKSIAEGVDAPAEEYLRYIEGRTSPEPEASAAVPETEEPESTDGEKTEDSDVSYPIPAINNLDTAVEADETFSSEEEEGEDRPPAPPPRVDSVTIEEEEEPDETITETDITPDRTQPEDAEEQEVEEVVLRIVEPLDETVLETVRKSEQVYALPPESQGITQDTSIEDTIIPDSDQQVEDIEEAGVDKAESDEEVVDDSQLKSPTKRVRFSPEAIYVSTAQEDIEEDEEGVTLSPIPEEDTTPGKQIKEPDTTHEEGEEDDSDATEEVQDTKISVEVDVHVSADQEEAEDADEDAPLAEEEILTSDDEATGSTADDKEETQTEVTEEGEPKEEESGPSAEEAHDSKDEADDKEQDEEGEEPQASDEKASMEEEEPSQEDEAVKEEEAVLDESDVSSVPRESLGEEELQALISDDWYLLTCDEAVDDDDFPPLYGYWPPKSPVGGQVSEPVVVEFAESYAEVLKKAPPLAEEETQPEDETPTDTETPQEDEATSDDKAPSKDETPSDDEVGPEEKTLPEDETSTDTKTPQEDEATSQDKSPPQDEAASDDEAIPEEEALPEDETSPEEEVTSKDEVPSEEEPTDKDAKEDDSTPVGPEDTPKDEESEPEEEKTTPKADEPEESQDEDTKASEDSPSPKEEISTPDDEKDQESEEEEKSQPPSTKQPAKEEEDPQYFYNRMLFYWMTSGTSLVTARYSDNPTEPAATKFAESFAAVVTKPPPVVEEVVEEAEPVESIPPTQDSGQAEDVSSEKEEEQEDGQTGEHAVPEEKGEDEVEELSKDDDHDTEPQETMADEKDEKLSVSDGATSGDEVVEIPSEVTVGDDKADDEEDIDGGSLEAVRGDTPTDEDLSEKADFESSEKTEGEDSTGADTSSVGSTEHDLKKSDDAGEISADDLPTDKADAIKPSADDNIEEGKDTPAEESVEETITSDHEASDDDAEEPVKEEDNKRSPLQRQGAMSKGESVESQESATSADTSDKAAVSKAPAKSSSTDESDNQDEVKATDDTPEEDVETGDDEDDALNKVQEGEVLEDKTRGTKNEDSSDSEDDSSSKIQPQALATGESPPRDDTKEQCEFSAVTSADREYQPNTGASDQGNTECDSDGHCCSEPPQAVSLPQSEMSCPEQDTGMLRVLPWARWEKIDDTSPRTVRRRPPSLELEAPVCEATSEESSPIQQSAEPKDIKEANESTPRRRSSTSSADTSEEEEEEEEAISSGDEEGEFDVPERTESPEERMTRTDAWATSGGTLYIGSATRMVRKQLPDIPEHSGENDSEASDNDDDDNQQDEVERPRQSAKLADSGSSEYTHDRHHEEAESSEESELNEEELHYLDDDDEEQVMMVEENIPEGNPLYLRQVQGEIYMSENTLTKGDTSSDDSEDEDKQQADLLREHDRLVELQEDLFEKDSLDDVDYHVTSSDLLGERDDQSNLSATEPTDYRCDDVQDEDLITVEQANPSNANEIFVASEGPGEDMDSDHEEFQVTVSEKHLADTSTQHLIVITKDTDEEKDRCEEKTSMDSFESTGPSTEGSSDISDDDASGKLKRRRRQKYGAQRSFTESIHHDPDSPTYISRMQFQFRSSQSDSDTEQHVESLPEEQECTPTQENIPFDLVAGISQQGEVIRTVEDEVNDDSTEKAVQEQVADSVVGNDQEDDTFDQLSLGQGTDTDMEPVISSDVSKDDSRRRSAEYTDSSDSESDTDSESETSADSILAAPGDGSGPSGPSGGQYRTPIATVPVTSYYVTSGVPFTMDPTNSDHVEIPPMPTSPRHSWGMQASYTFEEHQPVTTGLLTPIINGHIPVVKHHVQYDDLKRPIIPILLDIGDKLSPEYSGEAKTSTTASEREMLSPSPYDNLLESDLAEGEAQEGLNVESLQPMSCRCVAPPPDRKPFESPSDELELPPNPDFEPMDCLCTHPQKEARVVWSPKHTPSPRHSPQNVERCYEAISNTLATSRQNYVECKRQEHDAEEDETSLLNQSQPLHGDDLIEDMSEGRTVTMLQFDMDDDRSSATSSPLSVHSTHLGTPPELEEELDDSPAFSPTRQILDTFVPVSPPLREIRHPGITQDAIRAPRARRSTEIEDSASPEMHSPTPNRDSELKTPTGSLLFPYDKIHGPYPPPQDQPSFVTPDRRTQVKRKRPSDEVQGTSPRPTYKSPVRQRTDSPVEKCLSPTDHRPKDASPCKIPDDFPKLCTGKVRSMVNKWEGIVKQEPPKSPVMTTSSPSTPEIPRYGERDVISPPFSHHGSSPYYMSRRRTEVKSPEGAVAKQQKVPKHNVDVSARRPLHETQILTDEEDSTVASTEYGVQFQPTAHEDDAEKVLVYGYEVEWDIPRLQVCLSPLEGFDDDEDSMSDDVTISSLTETDGEGGVSASLSSLEEYILDPARILGKAVSLTELPMSPVEEEEESPAEESSTQSSSNTKEALSSHSVWERLGVLETPCPYFCQMWLPMLKYHLLDFQ